MKEVMPIEYIDDYQKRLERQDAFWQRKVIDRPVASIIVPSENAECKRPPVRDWQQHSDRWWDTEYVVDSACYSVMSNSYLGDSLPFVFPNLGPEVFSAFFGTELGYGESTAWSVPNLQNWDDLEDVKFSWDNKYLKKIDEMTDALIAAGKGKYYTGITDLHPGGDAIAAFRDPSRFAMDMIEHPDEVKKLLEYVTDVFCQVYDYFADRLEAAGQPISTFCGILSTKRFYIPSNDFSCMVSNEMFRDFFLPGIVRECRHLEASIYHLDGPGALRHLDSLLELDDLDAVQWVFGAGNGPASKWIDVYKKCQAAGKGVQVMITPSELEFFMDQLRPEGVFLRFLGVEDKHQADRLIKMLSKWT